LEIELTFKVTNELFLNNFYKRISFSANFAFINQVYHYKIKSRMQRNRTVALFLSFFFLFISISYSQKNVSWETLADVTFEEKYYEEVDMHLLYPVFGPGPKASEKKEVKISGYAIPVDAEGTLWVLSRYPNSSCFFCGGAGPESVVELQFKEKKKQAIKMDQFITLQGVLHLNDSDIDHMNYILKSARLE